jgi:hypothetical protein
VEDRFIVSPFGPLSSEDFIVPADLERCGARNLILVGLGNCWRRTELFAYDPGRTVTRVPASGEPDGLQRHVIHTPLLPRFTIQPYGLRRWETLHRDVAGNAGRSGANTGLTALNNAMVWTFGIGHLVTRGDSVLC